MLGLKFVRKYWKAKSLIMNDVWNSYAALHDLTVEMLAAAKKQNFEGLAALAEQYDRSAELLRKQSPPLVIDEPLIHRILDNQAQIAALTTPWLEQVRVLFREAHVEKNVLTAYQQNL